MDSNNSSYANLYGDENPKGDVVPPGVLPPEAEEVIYTYDPQLIKKGMIKTRVIGGIMTAAALIALCAILLVCFTASGSVETFISLGLLIPILLFMLLAVMYLLGKNAARIILGVLFALRSALNVLGLIPAIAVVASGDTYNSSAALFAFAVMLAETAVLFIPVYFTLIDKSVRAYSTALNEKGYNNGRT